MSRSGVTMTFAIVDCTQGAFEKIAEKLRAAGYDHAFMPGDTIDMSGLGLHKGEPSKEERAYDVLVTLAAAFKKYDERMTTLEPEIAKTGNRWIIDDELEFLYNTCLHALGHIDDELGPDYASRIDAILTERRTADGPTAGT